MGGWVGGWVGQSADHSTDHGAAMAAAPRKSLRALEDRKSFREAYRV